MTQRVVIPLPMRCSFKAHMQLLLQQQMACRMRRPGYRAGAR